MITRQTLKQFSKVVALVISTSINACAVLNKESTEADLRKAFTGVVEDLTKNTYSLLKLDVLKKTFEKELLSFLGMEGYLDWNTFVDHRSVKDKALSKLGISQIPTTPEFKTRYDIAQTAQAEFSRLISLRERILKHFPGCCLDYSWGATDEDIVTAEGSAPSGVYSSVRPNTPIAKMVAIKLNQREFLSIENLYDNKNCKISLKAYGDIVQGIFNNVRLGFGTTDTVTPHQSFVLNLATTLGKEVFAPVEDYIYHIRDLLSQFLDSLHQGIFPEPRDFWLGYNRFVFLFELFSNRLRYYTPERNKAILDTEHGRSLQLILSAPERFVLGNLGKSFLGCEGNYNAVLEFLNTTLSGYIRNIHSAVIDVPKED